MTNQPHLGERPPCAECGQPATVSESALGGDGWSTTYLCSGHRASRARAEREADVRAMSHDLARTPEEFMGREGHRLMLGGLFVRTVEDPEAPPRLAAWCARVLEICDDLPLREALRRRYLSPEELDAADDEADDD